MKKIINNFEEIICGIALIIMVIVVILNVILRYAFNYSIFWAEEVATICFIWLTFLGAAAVYKHKMDIGIDILIKKTPRAVQVLTQSLVRVILLLINGYIFYMSIIFTKMAIGKPTAVLGISSIVMNGALVISFGLITIHSIRFLLDELKMIKKEEQ